MLDLPLRPSEAIEALLSYAIVRGLIDAQDRVFCRNQLYDVLCLPHLEESPADVAAPPSSLSAILESLCGHAVASGFLQDTAGNREAFDTRLMGILTPKPGVIAKEFAAIEGSQGSESALDWFYQLGASSNYIRTEALARNIAYTVAQPAGLGNAPNALEITINLAKPEKDPRDIAAEREAVAAGYPKCLLCAENVGYPGHAGHPARQTLRVVPVELAGETWYLQYSPYQYYEHHCIVLCEEHRPMGISDAVFGRLLAFVRRFPSYFLGSNAGLPVVGGSILSHDHYQGGRHRFPMDDAAALGAAQWRSVRVEPVQWPMPCLRVTGAFSDVEDAARRIQDAWLNWSDATLGILCRTDAQHNAITPIAHAESPDHCRLDLVLRNNRTDERHPLGIFHPHEEKHHIKKENIGLIEVMGCMILPGRLQNELEAVARALAGESIPVEPCHEAWLADMKTRYANPTVGQARELVRREVGQICAGVLADAGVYKQTPEGRAGFGRFMNGMGIHV